jgi:NhaA family Na+:H+ antiporter
MPRTPAVERLTLPPFVRRFLETEAAGGIVLVVAAVAALVWANSPWSASYAAFLHADVELHVGTIGFSGDLHHFVNDGLMALFFLVVGLEIKRELVTGDLRDPRVAALPAFAAVGGMIVPALIYLVVNAGEVGRDGWGIPMATDIAFAVGVVALLGSRIPSSLKLFLLSLAVVDDVGAIVVIAIFYSSSIDGQALAIAGALVVAVVVLQRLRVHWLPLYALLFLACWVATLQSGIHPTIAGVVFGLLAPARPVADESVSPAERLEHALHPLTSFVIVPLFALVNAGVEIRSGAFDAPGASAVAVGIAAGLVIGKLAGVFTATWLAVRSRVASLPEGVTWRAIAGIAAIAGIGFTVSLFVTGLAFDDPALTDAATLAILGSSVLASLIGAAILVTAPPVSD